MPLGKQIVRKPARSIQVPVERPTFTGTPAHLLKCRNRLIKIIAGMCRRHLSSDPGFAARHDWVGATPAWFLGQQAVCFGGLDASPIMIGTIG